MQIGISVDIPAMEKSPAKPRVQLDRGAWIAAATDILAEDGLAGLRVELLAKRLKVTKGSFYWHFKDRSDLLQSVLEAWKDGRIRDIVKQTRAEPGGELDQLHHIIDIYSASPSRRGMLIELVVREWAQRDPAAAAIVGEVDGQRLLHARQLFLALGMSAQEAASRSLLLYAYVFGSSLMICDSLDRDLPQLKQNIAELLAGTRLVRDDPS
jgi:AcrR family transcriptional regulator